MFNMVIIRDLHSDFGRGDEAELYIVSHRKGREDEALLFVRDIFYSLLELIQTQFPDNKFLKEFAAERDYQEKNSLTRGWNVTEKTEGVKAFRDFDAEKVPEEQRKQYSHVLDCEKEICKAAADFLSDAVWREKEIYISEDEDYLRTDVIPVIDSRGQVVNEEAYRENQQENAGRRSVSVTYHANTQTNNGNSEKRGFFFNRKGRKKK